MKFKEIKDPLWDEKGENNSKVVLLFNDGSVTAKSIKVYIEHNVSKKCKAELLEFRRGVCPLLESRIKPKGKGCVVLFIDGKEKMRLFECDQSKLSKLIEMTE